MQSFEHGLWQNVVISLRKWQKIIIVLQAQGAHEEEINSGWGTRQTLLMAFEVSAEKIKVIKK